VLAALADKMNVDYQKLTKQEMRSSIISTMWRHLTLRPIRRPAIPAPVRRVLQEFQPAARRSRLVVIIQPGSVQNRARILKVTESLHRTGYSVVVFSKMPAGTGVYDVQVDQVAGCPVLAFPDAHDFLIAARTKIPALNWTFMVQYMTTSMWHYVLQLRPTVIQTFNTAAIGIGYDFRDRLRREGQTTAWFHDFPEYMAGHLFGDDGRVTAHDEEWKREVVAHERRFAAFPDTSFTVSDALADALVRDYSLSRRPIVLLNAPRLADFRPEYPMTIRRRLGLNADVPLFVYSGGVTPLRGVRTAVAAIGQVPEAHLALITNANTPYLDSLIAEARTGGFEGRLHRLPYVDPDAIPGFLRDATAGIHPIVRYGNAEVALPNKLFDYLHARIPIIVSDVREMSKFVNLYGLGEVFEPEDVLQLAQAMRRIASQRSEISERIASDKLLLPKYSWDEQEARLLNAYAAVAAPRD
jgi:glycosyltransferase involved in cell wall biosynthesis